MNNDSLPSTHSPGSEAEPSAVEARVLASHIEGQPNLRQWLLASVARAKAESATLLSQAARTLREDLREYGTAALLGRLAEDPALFHAVIHNLRAGEDAQPTEPDFAWVA